MEPLYFGPANGPLFGLRSEPQATPRRTAILICSSWGMEYMRAYCALSLLSTDLAGRGFDTLRFDYRCTGDSRGRSGEARLPIWIEDIGLAAGELASVSGTHRLCILGIRLGALLALRALDQGLRADQLVLWDAPSSGAAWMAQMRTIERPYYENKNRYRPARHQIRPSEEELLGLPMDRELAQGLAGLEARSERLPAQCLQLVARDQAALPIEGSQTLALTDDAHWQDYAWLTTPWTPGASLRQIGEHLARWLP